MNQHNYDAWVYSQLNPDDQPLRSNGAPLSKGGKGIAPHLAHKWWDEERRAKEVENTRMEDEYLRRHGVE